MSFGKVEIRELVSGLENGRDLSQKPWARKPATPVAIIAIRVLSAAFAC